MREGEAVMGDSEYADIEKIVQRQKKFFSKGVTKDISFRKKALKHLKRAVRCYEEELEQALKMDLGKHRAEAYMTEIGFVLAGISQAMHNVEKWAREEYVPTPVYMQPGRSRIRKEPYGSVLIIGPYNYPFQLLMEPLISAIAAGNCAVVRTSKQTPHTSEVIRRMLLHAFRPEYIWCAAGDRVDNQLLLKQRFDYIFFTGSPRIGRLIMKAAAENLIPVTLELGGKSPVIVDRSADLPTTARRIVYGGKHTKKGRFVGPAILDLGSVSGKAADQAVSMQDELFGPVLPVLSYKKLQEAMDFVNKRERPLALYIFTEDRDVRDRILEHTCSGGVCVNDTVDHLVNHRLPFGGVGNSGMGRYHGKYGFDTFTHLRAVYEKPPGKSISPGYPPYSEAKLKLIKKFLR